MNRAARRVVHLGAHRAAAIRERRGPSHLPGLLVALLAAVAIVLSGLGHGAAADPLPVAACASPAGTDGSAVDADRGDLGTASGPQGRIGSGETAPGTAGCAGHVPCLQALATAAGKIPTLSAGRRPGPPSASFLAGRSERPPHHPPIS